VVGGVDFFALYIQVRQGCRSLAGGQDAPSAKVIKKSNPNHSFASSGGSVFGDF